MLDLNKMRLSHFPAGMVTEVNFGDQMRRKHSTSNSCLLGFPFCMFSFASLVCSVFPVYRAVFVTVWPTTFWFAGNSRVWGRSLPLFIFVVAKNPLSVLNHKVFCNSLLCRLFFLSPWLQFNGILYNYCSLLAWPYVVCPVEWFLLQCILC